MDVAYLAENDESFQQSMYPENILRPLRSFAIKSNLNKIIALLFINWKLVSQVLQVLNCAPGDVQCRGDFIRMEIYHCELMFKEKNWRRSLFISVLWQMEFQVSSVLCSTVKEGKKKKSILHFIAALTSSMTYERLWAGQLKSSKSRAVKWQVVH